MHHHREKEIKPEPTTVDEHFKKAKTPWDIIHAEKHYSRQLKTWLGKVFTNFIVKELVLGNAFLQAAVKLILGNAWVQKFLDVVGATAAAATALLLFLSGTPQYRHAQPCGNPMASICQVASAACRNWKSGGVSPDVEILYEGDDKTDAGSRKLLHTKL